MATSHNTRTDTDARLRIGVDIGGTFTDIVAFDPTSGTVHTRKVPSTPSNPENGVIDGLEALFDSTSFGPHDVGLLSHGSTVTINALIERDGAKTGVLLTDGFDAIPVAGTGARPQSEVKNPRYLPPEPLVPQRRVEGIPERLDSNGNVVDPLDEEETRRALRALSDAGVESIAVCLLFSFLDADHERTVSKLAEDVCPDCSISLSSNVSPRIREYPRLATTVVDAYVGPLLERYLTRLERLLADRDVEPDELSMMFSHGGLGSFEDAARQPVHTLLSGPTAGVQGALFAAGLAGADDVITMDMGGTSCDVAVAPGGDPITTTEKSVSGHPVSVPMVDVRAIGAGGGTIARVEAGRLTVGPDSAGAEPGPICYGRGGTEVTVTDANAYLGRLNPESILGGDLSIDLGTVEAALESQIADPLGLTAVEAAAGIVDVVNDKMKKELSVALTQQGCDPRSFVLVTYGGAGPMHAVSIARQLAIERVIVPSWPGLNSAVGLLTTERKRMYERSHVAPLANAPINERFDELESTISAEVAGSETGYTFVRELELRYAGQSYDLTVPVDTDDTPATLRERFTDIHREAFGHTSDEPLETMTYRITAIADHAGLDGDTLRQGATDATATETTDLHELDRRPVYFDGSFLETRVYDRDELPVGARFAGPAIVEQMDTTTIVEPDVIGSIDAYGNLVLQNHTAATTEGGL